MDLNLDNYTNEELQEVFNINNKNINIPNAQKCLLEKIETVNKVSSDDLPESKDLLIEFYTKAMFKLLSIPINGEVKIDSSIFNNFEKRDTYINNINETESKEFINVKDKLIVPLENTPIVENNNHFITKHVDSTPVSTFNTNVKAGSINPLTRNTLKRILNINTKFRNNYTTTNATNFIFNLPSRVRKVISMQIIDSDFPKVVYTVSPGLGSNLFFIETSLKSKTPIDISAGSYNANSIIQAINNKLVIKGFNNIKFSFEPISGIITVKSNNPIEIFSLDFSYKSIVEYYNLHFPEYKLFCPVLPSNIFKDQLTLGWLLGFRGGYIKEITPTPVKYFACMLERDPNNIEFKYVNENSYTAESLFNGHGTEYFLISINDFQNNHDETFISPFQQNTISDNNILAKITTKCCNECCIEQPKRIYFGPVDLTRLEIKIYDEFGRFIDINNADYSLTVQLEIVYDL